MSVANDFFIDYYNQLIVHGSIIVYHGGPTGTFQVGEQVGWPSGAETDFALLIAKDDTNNILFLAYHTTTPTGTLEGQSSNATCSVTTTGPFNSKRLTYTGTSTGGGYAAGTRITFSGSTSATVVSDDTANGVLVVQYYDGAIADTETFGASGVVSGTPTTYNTTYTARQLYSYIQDDFDELDQMDDTVPMSAQTPTEFTLINGWFIDDESTKYIRGGAITTSGWTNVVQILTLDGTYTSAIPTDIGKQVEDDATEIGQLLHYNNTDQKWWIRASSTIADNSVMTIASGTGAGDAAGASSTGETLWANVYTLGTIATDPNPQTYIFQNSAALTEWWGLGDSESHIDVLIKVQEADSLIDSGNITVYARRFGDLYDHFTIDLSTGGRNAVPLATGTDLNNNASGEITIDYENQAGGNFTVGNFIRDESTGAFAEILADSDAGTTGTLTVGNVVGGADFAVSNGISETIDGTSDGDTGVSADITGSGLTDVVRGYNNIGIYFVNVRFDFENGSNEPSLYETITIGSATGVLLEISTTAGAWSLGNAAGTMTLGNWNSTTIPAATVDFDGSTTADIADTKNPSGQTMVSFINKAFEQGTAYPYNVIVECASRTMAEVYEWFKYVTREDANTSYAAAFNHITMYPVDSVSSPTAVVESDGEEYISASSTYTPVKASPFGTLAGGKLFGATGVWVEGMAVADNQNFQLIDSDGTTRTPPNFITITVNSVVSGDKITVFKTSSGTTIEKTQFTSDNGNSSGGTTFAVQESIPSDTPNSGHIRVVDTDDTSINREVRYDYISWTSSTFTLSGSQTLDRTYSAGEDTAYVPYFDEVAGNTSVSVTVIYNADQTVLTRVRLYDGTTPSNSILPFQITGTVTNTGYSVAAIRTADTIVTTYP